mmetsp:Transcript_16947/g.44493  ORF Transcript_16947/g.44493 Transcript_16947/m.44493 type:complete len:290 (+) Transcript_16947:950-1819(+)
MSGSGAAPVLRHGRRGRRPKGDGGRGAAPGGGDEAPGQVQPPPRRAAAAAVIASRAGVGRPAGAIHSHLRAGRAGAAVHQRRGFEGGRRAAAARRLERLGARPTKPSVVVVAPFFRRGHGGEGRELVRGRRPRRRRRAGAAGEVRAARVRARGAARGGLRGEAEGRVRRGRLRGRGGAAADLVPAVRIGRRRVVSTDGRRRRPQVVPGLPPRLPAPLPRSVERRGDPGGAPAVPGLHPRPRDAVRRARGLGRGQPVPPAAGHGVPRADRREPLTLAALALVSRFKVTRK